MEAFERNSFALPSDPNDASAQTLLAHWDELPAAGLRAIERDPNFGPRLSTLRSAERWLQSASVPESDCPTSEELYDFGRGPGYVVLTAAHKRHIEEHLSECDACEAHIETLTSAPPLPLEIAPIHESNGDEDAVADLSLLREDAFDEPPSRLRSHWMPLAAAAAVLVMTFVFIDRDTSEQWPSAPLLRGETEQALVHPRGHVLAPIESATWIGFANEPRFEVQPVEGASLYRVVLRQHTGGAFSDGAVLARLENDQPILTSSVALDIGNYTWEAWAIVDGLDQPLGARDFQVVSQPEIARVAAGLERMRAIRLLHEAGLVSDARSIARRMPASEERDRYLSTTPGR